MTTVPAAVFGALGAWYGFATDAEVSWLNPVTGGVIGVLFGALLGFGVSMEAREPKPKGARRVLVIVGLVFCAAIAVGMRYLRFRT